MYKDVVIVGEEYAFSLDGMTLYRVSKVKNGFAFKATHRVRIGNEGAVKFNSIGSKSESIPFGVMRKVQEIIELKMFEEAEMDVM